MQPGAGPDILLVSNGFGEAAVATYIARAIEGRNPAARIEHLPLVGEAAPDAWPKPVGPQASMPSGGLVAYWNLRNLAADLRAGLLRLTLRQIGYLRRQRARDVVVAVGDVYCLGLCLFAAHRPTGFVATAQSQLVARHSAAVMAVVRRADAVFARDEATAAALRAAGARASCAGNVMMDGLDATGADLGVRPGALVIALLPGSRGDSCAAAAQQIRRAGEIAALVAGSGKTVQALVSLAPSVEPAAMIAAIASTGIQMSAAGGEAVVALGARGNLEVRVVRGAFGDLLGAADLVLGQAGTANEQAAGSGKPVVAATQPGEVPERMRWYRMRQKRLLGDALLVLPGEPKRFAADVVRLLDDPARMEHMAETGRERMGGRGAALAVARCVLDIAAQRNARGGAR